MYRIKTTFFYFVLLAIFITDTAFSQQQTLSDNTKVSVITCGTGNEMYSLFGHTAIRITDAEHHLDEVYNYGTFDFNTPNFVLKFAKGDLQYMATTSAYSDFLNEYLYDKRDVYEQVLNLSLLQKQQLYDRLNAVLVSKERYYTYKFIDKNCTTMVVDILNKTLGEELIVKTNDKERTYREILFPYFDNHFYAKLGTSIIFGKKVDLKGARLFLPSELQQSINTLHYNNEPLCKENITTLRFEKDKTAVSWWNTIYFFGLIFLAIMIANSKRIYMIYFFLMGLLGLFLTFAGFYSLHHELAYNYNILLFNPLMLLLIYFYLKNNSKGIYWVSVLSLVSLAVYLILMINKIHLLIVSPFIITSLFGLIKNVIPKKNQPIS